MESANIPYDEEASMSSRVFRDTTGKEAGPFDILQLFSLLLSKLYYTTA